MCKVNGCDRASRYKAQDVCQMHYFRMMRTGSYEKKPNTGSIGTHGYRTVSCPDHPLASKFGRVFEHRKVLYDAIGENTPPCEICGAETSWDRYYFHVDHIDNDKLNNSLFNLRLVCNGCNTTRPKRDYSRSGRFNLIEYQGLKMTANAWSRIPWVKVCGRTIQHRIDRGMSVEQALTSQKVTHKEKK